MHYDLKTLNSEAMKMWSSLIKEVPSKSHKLEPPKKEIERGFNAYTAAHDSNLPFIVLGEADLRIDEILIKNMGTLATDSQFNQVTIKEFLVSTSPNTPPKQLKELVQKHLTNGSIINDSNWWIFRNDMFMLGGVHGNKEFHLASKKGQMPEDHLLWDKENNRPRVLGRELIMLAKAGYKLVQGPKSLGMVFVPPTDADQMPPLTLSQFRAEVAKVKSIDDIKAIFKYVVENNCAHTPVNSKN